MIKCFGSMAQKHNLSIIIAIHQPTLETLMNFHLLYVLAKGGVCMYSGRPQHLRQHMQDCHINIRDNQIPIEVILKVGANGHNDQTVIELSEKASKDMSERYEHNMRSEVKLCPNGIPIRSKQFSWPELWYLLSRKFVHTINRNWVLIIIQSGILLGWAAFSHIQFDFEFDQHFQCLPASGQSCPKSKESIEDSKIVNFNMKLLLLLNNMPFLVIITMTSLTFWLDFKIFLKEYKNCKQLYTQL